MNTLRRLLHVVHNFPPEFEGGTERYLAGLVALQRDAGVEVHVITGSDVRSNDPLREETLQGVPVTRLFRRDGEDYGVRFRHERILSVLDERIRGFAPDLLHVHHWFNLGDEILARVPGIPAVASFHDHYAACPRIFMIRPDGFFCGSDVPVPLQRCVDCVRPDDALPDLEARLHTRRDTFAREMQRIRFALCPSRFHGEVLVGAGLFPRDKLRVLPLGIVDWPAPAPHRPVAGKLRIVHFGNLSKMKGTDVLLDAVRAQPDRTKIELHLFGRPHRDEEAGLLSLAEGLPVIFHGAYDREALIAAAPDLDLAAFPSRAHETYGLVLEEAIALCLPIVVSDRGALPERVQGFGAVVGVEDAAPLSRLIQKLEADPSALESMRRRLPGSPSRLADHERALRDVYAQALKSR